MKLCSPGPLVSPSGSPLTAPSIPSSALPSLQAITSSSQPSTPSTSTRKLYRGLSGSDVTTLQQFLISQGLLTQRSATGYFGALTEAAVQKWQSQKGIVSSGTPSTSGYGAVGPMTRSVMALNLAAVSAMSSTATHSGATVSSSLPPSTAPPTPAALPQTTTYVSPTVISVAPTVTNISNPGPSGASSCAWNNQSIANGSSITAYQSSSVAYGSQCVSETETCSGGALSGSYSNASCTVTASALAPLTVTCSANSPSIQAGNSTTWTASSSGGSGGYQYSWFDTAGNSANTGGTATWTQTHWSAGTVTASVSAQDAAGHTASASCGSTTVTLNLPSLLSNITWTYHLIFTSSNVPLPSDDVDSTSYVSAAYSPAVVYVPGTGYRAGPGCLNRISASISGASAGFRLPSGVAVG